MESDYTKVFSLLKKKLTAGFAAMGDDAGTTGGGDTCCAGDAMGHNFYFLNFFLNY
jgi:hypothetical protein